jgi:hypothetical protein
MSEADSPRGTARGLGAPMSAREQGLARAFEYASRRSAVISWARLDGRNPRRWLIEMPAAVQSPGRLLTTAEAEFLAIGLAAAFVAATDSRRSDAQANAAADSAGGDGHA